MSRHTTTWRTRTAESIELYQQSRFVEAERGFSEALRIARDDNAEPLEICEALHNLAIAYFALSRFSDSSNIFKEAFNICALHHIDSRMLYACLLNNKARFDVEMERYEEAAAALDEAIEICEPVHTSYAAELCANLSRVLLQMPSAYEKAAALTERFLSLHSHAEQLEVYYDDLAAWRRPGTGWDRAGCAAAPVALEARSLAFKAMLARDDSTEARKYHEAILALQEQTCEVPPNLLVATCCNLADMAFSSGEFPLASEHFKAAQKVMNSCHLKLNPTSHMVVLRAAVYAVITLGALQFKQICDDAVEVVSTILGHRCPLVARCLSLKAQTMPFYADPSLDVPKEQEALARKCVQMYEDFYEDNHIELISMKVFWAETLIRLNRLEEAEALLETVARDALTRSVPFQAQCRSLPALVSLRCKQKRFEDAKRLVLEYESIVRDNLELPLGPRLTYLWSIAHLYEESNFLDEAERIYRFACQTVGTKNQSLRQKARAQLAQLLMNIGKADEAAELLRLTGDASTRREELEKQSRLAWTLLMKQEPEEANKVAQAVLNEAQRLMPDCEEALVISASILMDIANKEQRPDDMNRLVGMLSEYKNSIRLESVMPNLYLAVAQAYASKGSIKAVDLFKKSIEAAELIRFRLPQIIDVCIFSFMHYCATTNQTKDALSLCERLLELRADASGETTVEYAMALNAKATFLLETDSKRAEENSGRALKIVDAQLTCDDTKLLHTLLVRSEILRKLHQFEDLNELQIRIDDVTAKIAQKGSTGRKPEETDEHSLEVHD